MEPRRYRTSDETIGTIFFLYCYEQVENIAGKIQAILFNSFSITPKENIVRRPTYRYVRFRKPVSPFWTSPVKIFKVPSNFLSTLENILVSGGINCNHKVLTTFLLSDCHP